jgi:hypothetical protein
VSKSGGTVSPDSLYSSLREKTVEHLFLGAVLKQLWISELFTTEVSRAESDSFGYDVVIESGKIIRHIQLKSKRNRKPRKVSIAKSLADKPSGCVVVILIDNNFELGPFLWFGSHPREKLPSLNAYKASKKLRRDEEGNRPSRANHVDVPGGKFEVVQTIPEIVAKLFG